MRNEAKHLFVVTGGPGAGKTTLIDALEHRGYARSVEAGRGIIRDQVAVGGSALPWSDPPTYAELMLCWEMRSYHIAAAQAGPVILDRGLPDIVGYLRLIGLPVPSHIGKASAMFRYNQRVFVAPPWPEIFGQDAERKQTFEEAVRTYEAMVATYSEYGYELITLPLATVQERVQFVRDRIASCPDLIDSGPVS